MAEPEFTDTARTALLWVLWHHQGGSSPTGQAVRFALGMGQFDRLTADQVAQAKAWAPGIPGLAHTDPAFTATPGTRITDQMKRAAAIAMRVARGERWDDEKQDWITPGVTLPRATCKLCGADAGNNPHGPGVCVPTHGLAACSGSCCDCGKGCAADGVALPDGAKHG